MKSKQNNIKDVDEDLTILFKVVNKLEQRIATLEKVLASHAKCIGQLREEEIKTWQTTNTSGDKTIWVSSGKGLY